jgi:PAS domain S-box-containing protein
MPTAGLPPDAPTPPEPILSEAALRRLLELAGDTVWTISAEGRITYVSPAVERTRGYTVAEAMAQSLDQILTPDSIAKNLAYWADVSADLAAGREPRTYRGDMEYLCKDGSTFWSEVFCYPVLDEQGRFVELVGISRDIALRKVQEARERAEERLAAAGRMAAGVAHEVNNALAVIRAAVDLMPAAVHQEPTVDEGLGTIRGAVERVAGVMTQLLSFSGRRHVAPVVLPVGDAIAEVRPRLEQAALPARLAVHLDADARQATIAVDRVQWEQLLLHLVQNARDAMLADHEVRLVIGLRVLTQAEPMRGRSLPPGEYVELRVEDDGTGISPDIMERIFDPFFTTKPQDRGIGMGLPTVLGIAQLHGAGLQVVSRAGEGTSVILLWPCAGSALPAPVAAVKRAIVPRPAGPARVLVVDDEPMLRKLTMRLVERLGYRVEGAASGDEALERLSADPAGFDLLVTDIRMPGRSGTELVEALLARGIDLPVLYLSGQIDAPLPAHAIGTRPHHFLPKPFTAERLGEEVTVLCPAQDPGAGPV